MDTESILPLSLGVRASPGAYALLVGSGVSRSAQIPTAFDVINYLIADLAALKRADCGPDPIRWYRKTFPDRGEPTYSGLLAELAPEPAERQALLRRFFEPTDQERAEGIKVPGDAHRAIAELALRGSIRVIVTTNFDHLIENALRAIGVEPAVLATPEEFRNALPLHHYRCVVLKPHGDYLDPANMRNTSAELARYSRGMTQLLDRVFREYGLIVCGWSGKYDVGLCGALTSQRGARLFSRYWTTRRQPTGVSRQLIDDLGAHEVRIDTADAFFRHLADNVQALERLMEPRPLAPEVAVARLKEYLVDDRHRIRLHDLVMEEVESARQSLNSERFPLSGPVDFNLMNQRLREYGSALRVIVPLLIQGCYWGEGGEQRALWEIALERIAATVRIASGTPAWCDLQWYPTLLLLYSAGVAATASSHYDILEGLLTNVETIDSHGRFVLGASISLQSLLCDSEGPGKWLNPHYMQWAPFSFYVYDLLREPFERLLGNERRYAESFYRFECFMALQFVDYHRNVYARVGQIQLTPICLGKFARFDPTVFATIVKEFREAPPAFAPLLAGMFGGSTERLETAIQIVNAKLSQVNGFTGVT